MKLECNKDQYWNSSKDISCFHYNYVGQIAQTRVKCDHRDKVISKLRVLEEAIALHTYEQVITISLETMAPVSAITGRTSAIFAAAAGAHQWPGLVHLIHVIESWSGAAVETPETRSVTLPGAAKCIFRAQKEYGKWRQEKDIASLKWKYRIRWILIRYHQRSFSFFFPFVFFFFVHSLLFAIVLLASKTKSFCICFSFKLNLLLFSL